MQLRTSAAARRAPASERLSSLHSDVIVVIIVSSIVIMIVIDNIVSIT